MASTSWQSHRTTGDASRPHSSSSVPSSSLTASHLSSSTAVMRASLRQCIAACAQMNGFETAKPSCLEMLTHISTSYMTSICLSSKVNTEVAGRTLTTPGDIWLALVNMGHRVEQLPEFLTSLQRSGCVVVPPPKKQCPQQTAPALHIGLSRPHPVYVNEFLPAFPDPHTYIRTDIVCDPDSSYERVRELAAERRRDVESMLVSFMLRLHPHYCLFDEYDQKMRQQALNQLAERDRLKEMRPRTVKQSNPLSHKNSAISFDEQDILEDIGDEPMETNEEMNGEKAEKEDIPTETEETLTSLVRSKIPFFCNVLEPSHETRAYLSVLVTDEVQDDETAVQSSKEGGIAGGGRDRRMALQGDAQGKQNGTEAQHNGEMLSDEQTFDNLYLRAPRLPRKI